MRVGDAGHFSPEKSSSTIKMPMNKPRRSRTTILVLMPYFLQGHLGMIEIFVYKPFLQLFQITVINITFLNYTQLQYTLFIKYFIKNGSLAGPIEYHRL